MSAPPDNRLRLGRESRLRAGGDFVRLKSKGKRQVQGCLIFNWQPAEVAGLRHSRLGVVAGKSIGGAVIRNRAKRLLKEAFRLHQHELAHPVTAVLVARASIVGRDYQQVEGDFLVALRRARLLDPPVAGPDRPVPAA
jgi:ribonuclease P protein component